MNLYRTSLEQDRSDSFRHLLAKAALASVALALTVLPEALQAGVFTAGTGSGAPGTDVPISVTVSGFGRTDWSAIDFTLTWDTGVLTAKSIATPLFTSGTNFNTLNGAFSWFDEAGVTVPNGSTILQVTFTINPGASAGNYPIGFDSGANLQVTYSDLLTSENGLGTPGSLEVVPEPISSALALFACLFVGTSGARWVWRRRTARS